MKNINKLTNDDLNCNIFSVYDYNGLTMTELLSQFFTKINECVDLSNHSLNLTQWLVEEGLKLEVAEKLVGWLEDGTLKDIINTKLFNGLNELIQTKMDSTTKIKSNQLDTSTNESKIKLINLSDEVINSISGGASVSPTIGNLSITNEKYANNSIDFNKLKYPNVELLEYESLTIDLINLEVKFNNKSTFYVIENRIVNTAQEGSIKLNGLSGVCVLYLDDNNMLKSATLYPNTIPSNGKILCYIYATSDYMAPNKYNIITSSTKGFKIIDNLDPQSTPIDNSVTLNKIANPYCYNLLNNSITIDLINKKVIFDETVYIVCYDSLYSIKNHPSIDFSEMSTDGTLVLTLNHITKTFEFKTLYPNTMVKGVFILGYLYKDNSTNSFISMNNSFKLIGFDNVKSSLKWGVIGDSITHANLYQIEVTNKINIGSYENNAIVGSCVASSRATETAFVDRYLQTPYDCDIITIMGGINDCNNNIPIGSINNNDRETFIGAYQEIIEGLLRRNPSTRIMLFTPTPYWKNTSGRPYASKMIEYVNAVKEIANYYKLPCLDLHYLMGINEFTKNEFMTDMIHYNEKGYRRMGGIISKFIELNL